MQFDFGESSLLGMNYSTRDGVCSTQRQILVFGLVHARVGQIL